MVDGNESVYNILLKMIQEKLELQRVIKNDDSEQVKVKLANAEKQVKKLIEIAFNYPLCLATIDTKHRPYLKRLEKAASMIDALAKNPHRSKGVSGIQTEIDRANGLLDFDVRSSLFDRGLIHLFDAATKQIAGKREAALSSANQASINFLEQDSLYLVITRLIQTKIYGENFSGRILEAQNAYGDAAFRLEKLEAIEAEQGNRARAELYRLLRERVEQELNQSRTWEDKTQPASPAGGKG